MKISSIDEAVKVLQNYVPSVSKYSGDDLSLERMWPLLDLLGNPQKHLKVIHIAGTSGKTSTAYYIASILNKSHKSVGLTVSPHVDSITERIQINSTSIDDKLFCKLLGEFMDIVSVVKFSPSYFELLIAFVYWVFDKMKVDYAVIETGMGGLLDSTNVARRADKICVITDIGFDHMHILGSTIPQIAAQKAGIIHDENHVFMYKQDREVMHVVEQAADTKNAKLHLVSDKKTSIGIKQSEMPLFQQRNWKLAATVCGYVSDRDGFLINKNIDPLDIIVPGRMDISRLTDGSLLIMDGAHNGQKIATFVRSFREKYPNEKAIVLLALKTGKEYSEVIDILSQITDSFILTTFKTSQDLPAVSQDPRTLKNYCEEKYIQSVIISDHETAFAALINSNSKIKLVIGSFYLLGQVRKNTL